MANGKKVSGIFKNGGVEMKIKSQILRDEDTFGPIKRLKKSQVLHDVPGTQHSFLIVDNTRPPPFYVCMKCKQIRKPQTMNKKNSCFSNGCEPASDADINLRYQRALLKTHKKGKKIDEDESNDSIEEEEEEEEEENEKEGEEEPQKEKRSSERTKKVPKKKKDNIELKQYPLRSTRSRNKILRKKNNEAKS